MAEINSNEELNKQFIKICVHHPQNYNIPNPTFRLPTIVNKMKEKGMIPVLAVSGFKKPILAQQAYNWLKDNALKALNGGLDAYNAAGSGADNCSTIDQTEQIMSEFFNTEYNMGFADGKGETGKDYANIEEAAESRIQTFDDSSNKKSASMENQRRLDAIKSQRDADVPRPIQRVGGIGGIGMPQMPQMPGMSQSGMQVPQMPQMPGMPQMPQMPGMPQGGMSQMMPQGAMPQQMPNMPNMPNMPQYGYRPN